MQAGDPFQLSLSIAPDAGDQRGVSVEYEALPTSVAQDDIRLDDGKLRLRWMTSAKQPSTALSSLAVVSAPEKA